MGGFSGGGEEEGEGSSFWEDGSSPKLAEGPALVIVV